MKYVMLRCGIGSITKMVPIMFPDELVHADVAEYVAVLIKRKHRWTCEVVSAGEIHLVNDEPGVFCSGDSETLRVKSREDEDARVINCYNYCHGIE